MRRLLATPATALVLALVGALAGCARDDAPGTAGDPGAPSSAGAPEVRLVTGTAAGGRVGAEAVTAADEPALEELLATLDAGLARRVRREVEGLAGRGDVLVQVVAVGCEVPTSARLEGTRVVAEVPKPDEQCRVPVTTVALALP